MTTYVRMTHQERDPLYKAIMFDMLEMGDMELQAMRIFQQRILQGQKAFGALSPNKKDWQKEMMEECVDGSVYGIVKLLQLMGPEGRKAITPAVKATVPTAPPAPLGPVDMSKWDTSKPAVQKLWLKAAEKYGVDKAAEFGPKRVRYLLSGGTFGKLHREGDKRVGAKARKKAYAVKAKAKAVNGTGHKHVIKRSQAHGPQSAVITNPQGILNGVDSGSRQTQAG